MPHGAHGRAAQRAASPLRGCTSGRQARPSPVADCDLAFSWRASLGRYGHANVRPRQLAVARDWNCRDGATGSLRAPGGWTCREGTCRDGATGSLRGRRRRGLLRCRRWCRRDSTSGDTRSIPRFGGLRVGDTLRVREPLLHHDPVKLGNPRFHFRAGRTTRGEQTVQLHRNVRGPSTRDAFGHVAAAAEGQDVAIVSGVLAEVQPGPALVVGAFAELLALPQLFGQARHAQAEDVRRARRA